MTGDFLNRFSSERILKRNLKRISSEQSRSTLNRFFKVTTIITFLFSAYEIMFKPTQICSCVGPAGLYPPCCLAVPSWYFPVLSVGAVVLILSVVGVLATRPANRITRSIHPLMQQRRTHKAALLRLRDLRLQELLLLQLGTRARRVISEPQHQR